jgi:hypothetical protein
VEPSQAFRMTASIVVHPPSPTGGRRITADRADGDELGLAHGIADLVEILRRAGMDPDQVRLDDPVLIEWRGGRVDVWE